MLAILMSCRLTLIDDDASPSLPIKSSAACAQTRPAMACAELQCYGGTVIQTKSNPLNAMS